MQQVALDDRINPGQVLSKALVKAAEQLGLTNEELGRVVGVHRTSIGKIRKEKFVIDPDSKEGELSKLFLRVARALYALNGGDTVWMRHFLRTPNKVTRGVPAEQMQTVRGLVAVLQFVDGIRGKV